MKHCNKRAKNIKNTAIAVTSYSGYRDFLTAEYVNRPNTKNNTIHAIQDCKWSCFQSQFQVRPVLHCINKVDPNVCDPLKMNWTTAEDNMYEETLKCVWQRKNKKPWGRR